MLDLMIRIGADSGGDSTFTLPGRISCPGETPFGELHRHSPGFLSSALLYEPTLAYAWVGFFLLFAPEMSMFLPN